MRQQSWIANILNALLIVAVAIPAVVFLRWFNEECPMLGSDVQHVPLLQNWTELFTSKQAVCAFGMHHPLNFLHAIFFVNVCVLFWVISIITGTTWLIDPYWTILPVMMAHYFQLHPSATTEYKRSAVSLVLVWAWSIRLTHSYFRREEWQFGVREDWRFTEMRNDPKFGRFFWLHSFFTAYVSQQFMLIGVTLPYYAIHTSAKPWSIVDCAIAISAVSGLTIAYFADTQLRNFMVANTRRAATSQPKILVLDTGVWKYCRRPNYFGEILWWSAVGAWGVWCGQAWTIVGTLFNTIVLVSVTFMVEEKMLRKEERRQVYMDYCRRTPMLVPWFTKAKPQ